MLIHLFKWVPHGRLRVNVVTRRFLSDVLVKPLLFLCSPVHWDPSQHAPQFLHAFFHLQHMSRLQSDRHHLLYMDYLSEWLVYLLTICVRWCSESKRVFALVASASNSLNFCSIWTSSSATSGRCPSLLRCRAVSEKIHDLVSSVHELLGGKCKKRIWC